MRPDPGVIFVLFIVAVIGLAAVAYGVLLFARWQANRIRYVAPTRVRSYPLSSSDRRFTAVSSAETNSETGETAQRVAETEEAIFHSGENTAIARLIVAGAIKLTEGVKEGTGKRSGDAYSKRSKEIQAIVKQMKEPEYPALTAQQRPSVVEKL